MRATGLGLVALLLLMLFAPPRRAPHADEPTEAERKAALERAAELGKRFFPLWRAGKHAEAEPLAREALALRERHLGPAHPDVAESLLQLGATLSDQAHYEEAEPLLRRSVEIREEALGPDHTDVAVSLTFLGLMLKTQGRYDEAEPLYERALAIRETAHGPEHRHVAASLHNLAELYVAAGRHEAALPLHDRALEIRVRRFGPTHRTVARSLDALAKLNRALGRHRAALPLYERALEIKRTALGPNHAEVATTLHNLALLLHEMGRISTARALAERALAIRETAHGPAHPRVASALENLGVMHLAEGAHAAARALFERSLEINTRVFGRTSPHVALSLHNLAETLRYAGQIAEARTLHERALAIREEALGPDHVAVAESLNGLGGVLRQVGEYDAARTRYERALAIVEHALRPHHPDVAVALNNLAVLLRVAGDPAAAVPLYQRALSVKIRAFGADHPEVATSLNNLGVVLRTTGRLGPARTVLERALSIYEQAYGEDAPAAAAVLSNLAAVCHTLGEHAAARAHLARALDIAEKNVRELFLGWQASERIALVHSLRYFLERWLQIAPNTGDSGYAEVLRLKGMVARATAAERRLARRGGPDVGRRVAELRDATRHLAELKHGMPPRLRKEEYRAWRAEYAEAAARRERRAVAVARDLAPLREGTERLDLTLDDVRGGLSPRTVLVDYLRAGDRYLAWVVPAVGPEVRVDLGAVLPIEDAARAFAERAAEHGADFDEDAWREAGRRLRHLVLAPLEPHLPENTETLCLCPDAALATVPFACVPSASSGRFLGDDHALVTVAMAQDLLPWPAAPRGRRGALLLGGVDYGRASETVTGGVLPLPRPTGGADRAPRGGHYAPLPATHEEVKAIAAGLGVDAAVLSGAGATEAGLRAGAPGRHVLHLATHGFVRDDLMRGLARRRSDSEWLGADTERQLAQGHDPMLLAGLALAGANPRDGGHGDDGILTALEASHLDLDGVDLVVLSACETALGRAESGEGVLGLVQAFQMAGAKQVVGSLWRVDDDATRALMVRFYELWRPVGDGSEGLDAAVALERAQAHVRSHAKWKQPYYWAAWVRWGPPD